jgi:hypothetical protein
MNDEQLRKLARDYTARLDTQTVRFGYSEEFYTYLVSDCSDDEIQDYLDDVNAPLTLEQIDARIQYVQTEVNALHRQIKALRKQYILLAAQQLKEQLT